MARKYSASQAVDLLFDDEFGLSDGVGSEEEGEEVYCYLGEASLTKESVGSLGSAISGECSGSSRDHSEGESEEEQFKMPSVGKISLLNRILYS